MELSPEVVGGASGLGALLILMAKVVALLSRIQVATTNAMEEAVKTFRRQRLHVRRVEKHQERVEQHNQRSEQQQKRIEEHLARIEHQSRSGVGVPAPVPEHHSTPLHIETQKQGGTSR